LIERGKFSALQMALMMNPAISATALLLVPAITAKHAKQDLWLSPIWACLIGFLALFLAYKLNKIYPKETMIEYSELILGKFLGKFLGALFLFFYLHITGIIVREYGEFVSGTFLHHTPMIVILGTMVLVCSFAVNGGLKL
jgi:spore germination protein KB